MKRISILVAFSLLGLGLGACTSSGDDDDDGNEVCTNGVDDDGDSLADCADTDCSTASNCQTICGDGTCSAGETATSCPDDCATGPVCGNGTCEAGETAANCAADCSTGPVCGNGTCEAGETAASCPADCSTPAGDLSCMGLSYCYSCCPDQACADACNAAAMSSSVTELGAVYSCMDASCATQCDGTNPDACSTCMDTNCASQLAACDWAPAGTASCIDLNNCLVGCPDLLQSGTAATCPADPGMNCYNDCFGDADQDAIDKLFTAVDCINQYCATECGPSGNDTDCGNCQQTNCGTQVTACVND